MVHAPAESLILAYAAVIPILVGAVAVWVTPGSLKAGSALAGLLGPASLTPNSLTSLLLRGALTWSAAILCFLAGVRRGLSFRQAGGPTVAQIASMAWFFTLGAAALLSPWMLASALLLIAGYLSMLMLDPIAARTGEAPRYFARLRPPQLLLLLACLASLLIKLLAG